MGWWRDWKNKTDNRLCELERKCCFHRRNLSFRWKSADYFSGDVKAHYIVKCEACGEYLEMAKALEKIKETLEREGA
jgi:hypothetical protein